MAVTTELGKSGVDTKELRKLTKDFRGWNPDKQLKRALRLAGEMVAEDAKVIVKQPVHFHGKTQRGSTTVPDTIKVRISKTRLSVVAGGPEVPLGGLLEMGNRGKQKSAAASKRGEFRHPVFEKSGQSGNWKQGVAQSMNPYLLPAAERNTKKIEALEGAAVAKAFEESDFKVLR
jgi:hypothetical protein